MKLRPSLRMAALSLVGVASLTMAIACGGDDDNGGATGAAPTAPSAPTTAASTGGGGANGAPDYGSLSGVVEVDGSSTVYPITAAVAEEFAGAARNVQVPVGVSGTGGGFSRFCNNETDISNASRPIRSGADSESARCEAAGISFIEIPVAYDGLSVVIHPDNDWATCMTVEELNMLWEPDAEGVIMRWNQIRPEWPNEPINLFGAGTDSGTFDYFTEVINGEAQASRGDFTASEDDNVLVIGVAGDRNALGFFGLAYLEENLDKIKGVAIDGGGGCVEPNQANVEGGSYVPLSRPLFIYVKEGSLDKPEVVGFVNFYLDNAAELARDVGYVQFPDTFYAAIKERWEARETGSIFSGVSGTVGGILGVE